MEASLVVCEPLKPPRFCDTENQPEVRKTATQKQARGAMCGARGAFVSPIVLLLCGEGGKATTGGDTQHCCSANRAAERWCIIANAIAFIEMIGRHTPTHTHTHTHTHPHTHTLYAATVSVPTPGLAVVAVVLP